jgi:hypothetical protein
MQNSSADTTRPPKKTKVATAAVVATASDKKYPALDEVDLSNLGFCDQGLAEIKRRRIQGGFRGLFQGTFRDRIEDESMFTLSYA